MRLGAHLDAKIMTPVNSVAILEHEDFGLARQTGKDIFKRAWTSSSCEIIPTSVHCEWNVGEQTF